MKLIILFGKFRRDFGREIVHGSESFILQPHNLQLKVSLVIIMFRKINQPRRDESGCERAAILCASGLRDNQQKIINVKTKYHF